MNDLPDGWTLVPLASIGGNVTQRVPSADEVIRYIDIGSVNRNTKTIESLQEMLGKDAPSRARKQVAAGDTLVSMTRPNLNAVALVGEQLDGQIASTGFDVLRPHAGIDPRWISYLVRTEAFVGAMSALVQGALYPAIRSKDVRAHVVPLAPQAEQTRIANQLDTLLASVQACNDRFDAIPALLRRFRHTVLDAATTGQLTDDWRKDNLRQVTVEEVVTARLAVAGARPTKAASEYFAIHQPVTPKKGTLPNTWLLTHIGMVGVVSNGSTPSRQEPSYWGNGIPWVSSGEVANGVIRRTREQITSNGFKNSSVRLLPRGSVLMAMIGEGKTRGQSAILDIDACINQNVAGVVPIDGILDSKYLWFWFRREYENTRTKGNGSGPKALNCERVRELEINLPPLTEQVEIVSRVEALFALADRIEARCTAARAQAQRLSPLVLAKAFRGELVEQHPQDEPASTLLQRIALTKPSKATVSRGRPRIKTQELFSTPEVVQPDWTALPDGVWAGPEAVDEHVVMAILVAVLKAWGGPMPQTQARLAAVLCLQPRQMTAVLSAEQATQWQRLVGHSADPLPTQVVRLQPATDSAWRKALLGMRARGDLMEMDSGPQATWALAGGAVQIETAGWPEGRAGWVVAYLRAHGAEAILPLLEPLTVEFVYARAA